jgi:hypothetical protein
LAASSLRRQKRAQHVNPSHNGQRARRVPSATRFGLGGHIYHNVQYWTMFLILNRPSQRLREQATLAVFGMFVTEAFGTLLTCTGTSGPRRNRLSNWANKSRAPVLSYRELTACQLNLTFRRRRLDLADCRGDD